MKITPYDKIYKLLSSDMLTLYTIQDTAVLKTFEKQGFITGEHSFSLARDNQFNDFFASKYMWMQKQMSKKLKNYSKDLPIWAWTEAHSDKSFKQSGTVKFTIEVPQNRCLISDFDLWGGILNNCFYSKSLKKMDNWIDKKYKPTAKELNEGYELCFYITPVKSKNQTWVEYVYGGDIAKGRYLQVCVDRLYENEIKKIQIYD